MKLQKPSPKLSGLNKIAPREHIIKHIICTEKVTECSSTGQEEHVIYG